MVPRPEQASEVGSCPTSNQIAAPMARKSQGPPTNRRQTIAPPPVALVLSWGEGAIRIREPAMERGGTTKAPRHQETRDGRGAWWAPPPRARVPPASLPVIWIRLALPHPPPTTRRATATNGCRKASKTWVSGFWRQSATGIPAGDLDSFGPAASPANNPPGDRHQRMPEGKQNMGVWFLVSPSRLTRNHCRSRFQFFSGRVAQR